MFKHFKKLNSKGFSHVELGMLTIVVLVVAAVGVHVFGSSHADQLTTTKSQSNGLIYSSNFGFNDNGSGFTSFYTPSNFGAQYSNVSPNGSQDVFFEAPYPYRTLGLLNIGSTTPTNIKNLPSKWSYISPPIWSPNGQNIAVVYCKAHVAAQPDTIPNTEYVCGNKEGIWALSSNGQGSHSILNVNSGLVMAFVGWEPASDVIVYVLDNDSGNQQLCTIKVTGKDNSCVTIKTGSLNVSGLGASGIAVSPDGTQVLLGGYTGGKNSSSNIYEVGINGTGLKELTNFGGGKSEYIFTLAWSPDGTKIAYIAIGNGSSNSGVSGYYVVNANGSDPTSITLPSGTTIYPDSLSWASQ